MKTITLRTKAAPMSKTRWVAYAAAAAATAVAGDNSAEAAIHYSGLLHEQFPARTDKTFRFPLDQAGDSFQFIHSARSGSGAAYFQVFGISSAYVRGFVTFTRFASRLSYGQNVSEDHFAYGDGLMANDVVGEWTDPGIGYIGFRFNNGAGIQYGWVRVRMGGRERNSGFEVLGYAYADPGEPITAGQRSSEGETPDKQSLAWLALGAAGLRMWRKSRSRIAE